MCMICPKCGAIAEYNAYYERITCTRCFWESEKMKCSDCKYFEYEETWNGEEEFRYYICHNGHYEGIGWWTPACSDFKESE